MTSVIRFPLEQRMGCDNGHMARNESATVIILPVIRIDRHGEEPAGGRTPGSDNAPGGGRRRRAGRP